MIRQLNENGDDRRQVAEVENGWWRCVQGGKFEMKHDLGLGKAFLSKSKRNKQYDSLILAKKETVYMNSTNK